MKRVLRRLASPVVSLLIPWSVTVALGMAAIGDPGAPMDEASLLVYPGLVLAGRLPHRDFQTFYGPGNLWILGFLYHVLGTAVEVERAIGIGYRLILVTAVFLLCLPGGRLVSAAGAFMVALILGNDVPAAITWLPAMTLVVSSIVALLKAHGSLRHAAAWAGVSGLTASVTLLFRPELGAAELLAAAPALYWGAPRLKSGYIVGFIVGLVPLAGTILTATPQAFFRDQVVDAVFRSGPGRRLPLVGRELTMDLLVVFLMLVPLTVVAAAALRGHRQKDRATIGLTCATFLGIALIPEAVARLDFGHVALAAVVTVGVLPLAVDTLLYRSTGRVAFRRAKTLAFSMALLTIGAPVYVINTDAIHLGRFWWPNQDSRYYADSGHRHWPVASSLQKAEIESVLADVRSISPPGTNLFVGPADLRRTNSNDSFFYYLLPELEVRAFYIEMEPGTANRTGSGLSRDIALASTVILTHSYDAWDEPNASMNFGSDEPNILIRASFCLQAREGPYEVLRRCQQSALDESRTAPGSRSSPARAEPVTVSRSGEGS